MPTKTKTKAASKRGQSGACTDYAEREQARPKVKTKTKTKTKTAYLELKVQR